MDWADLTDRQLQLIVKSVGITYDATTSKLKRLKGRFYDEALDEAETCNEVLAIAKTEQNRRWRVTS